ncbi:MAG: YqgE/AlgH family protein [Alphaproteobacteria bacterium]|jgi:putative transcriptional regulator
MSLSNADSGYLEGQLLIAMPAMTDERFERAVIYMCAHNEEGAMGLIVNKVLESISFDELLSQLDIEPAQSDTVPRIHFGGPVESGRGFVLHSADYMQDSSIAVDDNTALTATIDILRDLAAGGGPKQKLLAIGYAGWGPGQLESEIHENAWLHAPVTEELLFGGDDESKWNRALKSLGVDVSLLSGTAGRA